MKIAVVSDIHGNMAYLAKAKTIIDEQKLEIVVCCGDIQDEEAFLELDSWEQKVYIAFGNADYAIRENLGHGSLLAKHVEVFLDYGVLNIGGTKLAFCHYSKYAEKLAESGRFDIVFYGHDHKPWERKIGRTVMLNPGEIQARDGRPTFAIYDLAHMKAELKILI
jgi:putative phosphoesterase